MQKGSQMDFKTFSENADIVYSLKVFVNDNEAITIEAQSEESMLEQLNKADYAIKEELNNQFESLADYED